MIEVFNFIEAHIDTISLIVTILFFLSEALAEIPSIKANNVFRLIVNLLVDIKKLLPIKTITIPTKDTPVGTTLPYPDKIDDVINKPLK